MRPLRAIVGITHADVAPKLGNTFATCRAPLKIPGGMCPLTAAMVGQRQKVDGWQIVARGANARRTQLCSFGSECRTVTTADGRRSRNDARSSRIARAVAQSHTDRQWSIPVAQMAVRAPGSHAAWSGSCCVTMPTVVTLVGMIESMLSSGNKP